jgi:hypothetical protein
LHNSWYEEEISVQFFHHYLAGNVDGELHISFLLAESFDAYSVATSRNAFRSVERNLSL